MLSSQIITDWNTLGGLSSQWQQLISATPAATIFQTPKWILGWRDTLPHNASPFCIALFEAEYLVGLVLLQIEKNWGTRLVRFIGTPLNDSNCVLVHPRYTLEFSQAIQTTLREYSAAWDALHLTELAPNDSLYKLAHETQPSGWLAYDLRPTFLPTLELPPRWDLYWKQLSQHRRKRFNYSTRHLEASGELQFHFITGAEELAQELPRFFANRLQNWQARGRLSKIPAFQRTQKFLTTLSGIAIELARAGHVWLARLDAGMTPMAWKLGFCLGDTIWSYMTTYNLQFAHYSPGLLIVPQLIRHAITMGMKRYVMGRGGQSYKLWLGALPRNTTNLVLAPRSVRGLAFLGRELARDQVTYAYHTMQNKNRNILRVSQVL